MTGELNWAISFQECRTPLINWHCSDECNKVPLPHSLKFGVSRSVNSETHFWCFTSAQLYRTAHTDVHYNGKDKSDITELPPLKCGGLYSCEVRRSCAVYYVLIHPPFLPLPPHVFIYIRSPKSFCLSHFFK